jgi:hypothetical protein
LCENIDGEEDHFEGGETSKMKMNMISKMKMHNKERVPPQLTTIDFFKKGIK